MAEVYDVYVGGSISSREGVPYWIGAGQEEQIGDRVFIRRGKVLCEGRQGWHDTKAAALEDAAAQIDAMAHRLWAQAALVREKANDERLKQAQAAAGGAA